MAQYNTGTVKVLSADPNRWVLLGGTTTGNIAVGNLVKFDAEPSLWFTVATIIDDLTFETVENYNGSRLFDTHYAYVCTRDFTPNLGLPEVTQGDRNTADIYTRAMRKIDALVGSTQLAKLTNATGGTLVAGDAVTYSATVDRAVGFHPYVIALVPTLVCVDASIANGAQGLFATEGVVLAKVTGTVTRGNFVQTSSTPKTLVDMGAAALAMVPGAVGVALSANVGGFATILLLSGATTSGTYTINTGIVGNVGGGEDVLQSIVLQSGAFARDGRTLRLSAHGFFANNTNVKTVKFKFGATGFLVNAITPSPQNVPWTFEALITRTASNVQRMTVMSDLVGGVINGWGQSFSTEVDSGAITLHFTGQSGSSVTNDVQQLFTMVEWLN